jgi:OmcA/MtrC family decaheme c-type cytochrome
MVHKIHMGSSLPSVVGYLSGTTTVGGTPYEIIGYENSVNNFSGVVFPSDIRTCTKCHTSAASQALQYSTNPTAAACGSCHDDVDFATGVNHPGGPQFNDDECATCHIP